MRLITGISFLLVLMLINLSFTYQAEPGPKKKIYRDTIYRFRPKTEPVPKAPAAKAPVIAEGTKPSSKPLASKLPVVAEEDRKISITSAIKRFVVKKALQKMYVYFADTFKVFRISLGANPLGPKQRQGDNKTPEGKYSISYKNPNSRGHRSLKISYPNEVDKAFARRAGFDPGGDIFIHGLWWDTQDPKNHWKDNWTRGCIAVNNSEIEEIFDHTDVNTEIEILP